MKNLLNILLKCLAISALSAPLAMAKTPAPAAKPTAKTPAPAAKSPAKPAAKSAANAPFSATKEPDYEGQISALAQIRIASQLGQYQKAYQIASEACQRRCSNVALNFALMHSALQVGEYDEALAASDRVLIAEPNNITAHFVAAKIYKLQGNKALFRAELEQISALSGLRAEHRALLAALSSSDHEFYGMIALSGGYERNPQHQTTKDFYYHTSIGDFKIPASEVKNAAYWGANAQIGLRNQLGARTFSDISLFSYNKYFAKPRSEGFSDISAISASAAINHQLTQRMGFGASAGYDYTILRGKGYSHAINGDLSATFLLGKSASLTLGGTAGATFMADSLAKDDNSRNFGGYAQGVLGFKSGYAFARAAYVNEQASKSESKNSDFDQFALSIGAKRQFSELFAIRASATGQQNFYKKENPGFRSKRRDKTARAELAAEFATRVGDFELGSGYAKSDSNHDLYDYDNLSFFAGYKYRFN